MIGRAVVVLSGLALLAGCSLSIPTDPDGTLDDVRGGVLRVGVSVHPPWTTGTPDARGGPGGIEPDLVRGFAESVDAQVQWTDGSEADLMDQLHRGELDLVVAGLTATSPWSTHGALTYPYAESEGPEGSTELHVMAVPAGENAFMTELEAFLLAQDVRP